MESKKVYIDYSIHYNWPPGKNSFANLHIDKNSIDDGIKAVVMAKKDEDSDAYTFTEFTEEHFQPADIMKVITEGASKGRYLTGNIFFVEIYNKNGKCIGKSKLNAAEKKPANASGASSVHQNYLAEIEYND